MIKKSARELEMSPWMTISSFSAVADEAAANFLANTFAASASLIPNRDNPITDVTDFFLVRATVVISISAGPKSFFLLFPVLGSILASINVTSFYQG